MNSMTPSELWRADTQVLQGTLLDAATLRPERPGVDAVSGELEWVLFERQSMHAAVNRLRSRDGKAPVGVEQIQHAETSASGHIDYAAKFAMRCADIVHAP